MRLDSPAARMTAANTSHLAGWRRSAVLALHGLVGRVGSRVAANGDQLGGDADGDLFRGERADFQADGRVYALEFLCRDAFLFERLVHGEHLALAADHADVACRP